MKNSSDVVIIGGAGIGSAIAWFLTAQGFAGRITVIEKDMSFCHASTALSAGGVRQQFSTGENIALSQFAVEFFSSLKDRYGADGDVSFCQQGYLSLASHEGKKVLAQNHATQTAAGADIIYMHPPELVARFPWIDFDGIAAGCFGASGEGWIDGWSLMNVLRREARKNGAVWLNDEVTGLEVTNNTVEAVRLAGGGKITCGHVVNAAGIAARDIAAMAGIDLPVVPAKRYVFAFDCRETTPAMTAGPLMVDPSGFYVRPEGTGFICGLSPKPGEEPEPCGFDVDYSWFEERIWPLMAARIPAFEAIKLTGAWTGYYAMNTFDQNAICGPHPEIANFYFANGFSGHGLQQTPGIGRAIAELIGYGSYRSLDLHRFGFERIAANSPAAEVHVI